MEPNCINYYGQPYKVGIVVEYMTYIFRLRWLCEVLRIVEGRAGHLQGVFYVDLKCILQQLQIIQQHQFYIHVEVFDVELCYTITS